MNYYSYHSRIKQRIANGELVAVDVVDSYKKIGACALLYFSTYPPIRPIRPYRFDEYAGVKGCELLAQTRNN